METPENQPTRENSILNNTEINNYLLETSKWGKMLAIIGYVGIGLMILLALFMMIEMSEFSRAIGSGIPMRYLGFIYVVIAIIYYFPVTYLHKFSDQIKLGLQSKEIDTLTSGFRNLKSLFKFMGIFTIVMLCFYGLMLLIAIPTMLLFNS